MSAHSSKQLPVFAPFIRDADLAPRAPWHVPTRRLLDYLLIYVEQGQCVFTVDDRRYELQPRDFCLIQPGQSVELRGLSHTVTPYAHFDVWFNARREESFATRPGMLDLSEYRALLQPRLDVLAPFPTVFVPDADFRRDWLAVVENWNSGEVLARLEAQHQLGSLLLRLARTFVAPRSVLEPPRPLGWIPSYLSTHLGEAISVSDMAARARLSPSRFQAVFRAGFGTSPRRYLMQMRVEHAATLLTTTDWTLGHIAHLCGFADVHHFAKAFKSATGTTPGKHRKSVRGEKNSEMAG